MKKTYICPDSVQLNMEAEQMIASSLSIKPGEADQLSNEKGGWNSEDWSGEDEEEF